MTCSSGERDEAGRRQGAATRVSTAMAAPEAAFRRVLRLTGSVKKLPGRLLAEQNIARSMSRPGDYWQVLLCKFLKIEPASRDRKALELPNPLGEHAAANSGAVCGTVTPIVLRPKKDNLSVTAESGGTPDSAAAVWDREASSYDASRQKDPVYLSCIHQVTNSVPSGTNLCLDAGCGTGLSTTALSSRCDFVIAVDYSIKSLRILSGKGLPKVFAVQANLRSLPFKDSVFDAGVSANTLQHFNPRGAQQRAVAEMQRVIRDRGILCLSVHHYSRNKRRHGWIKEGKPGQAGIDYIFRFSRDDLLYIAPSSTIRGIGYYGVLKVPYLGSRLQNFLAYLLGRVAGLFGYGHMLTAVAKNRKSEMTALI